MELDRLLSQKLKRLFYNYIFKNLIYIFPSVKARQPTATLTHPNAIRSVLS